MGGPSDLDVAPGEDRTRPRRAWRRNRTPRDVDQLWSALLREPRVRPLLAVTMLASLASGLLEALLLALLANLAVTIGGGASLADLPWPLSVLGHLTIGQAALIGLIGCAIRLPCQHLVAYISAKIVADTQVRLRTRVSEAYANATWLARVSLPEGRLHETALAQADQTAFALLVAINTSSAAVSLMVLVGAALMLNPPAAVAIIVAVGLLYSMFRPLTRRVRIHADAHAAANLEFASLLGETAQLNAETQAFGVTEPVLGRLRAVIGRAARPLQRTTYLHGLLPAIYQSAALGIVLLGMLVANGLGRGSLAAMGSVVLLLLRALSYGVAVQSGIQRATEAGAYAAEVVRTLSRLEGARRDVGSRTLEKVSGIELRSVGHTYGRGADDALADLSLRIELGSVLGVVGPSGSGKSTLAHVLCRLLRPGRGDYLVNGKPSFDFDEESWSRCFAFVPQDGHLLTASIADNIRFHRDGFGDDEVRAAAVAAHIHAEIMSWPARYETVVGQRSEALSGGQRQRICLARALLGQPTVLVLDEPTSALDARSEELILQSLRALSRRMTMVIITHRSSLLQLCDRVIDLGEGQLKREALALSTEHIQEAFDAPTSASGTQSNVSDQ